MYWGNICVNASVICLRPYSHSDWASDTPSNAVTTLLSRLTKVGFLLRISRMCLCAPSFLHPDVDLTHFPVLSSLSLTPLLVSTILLSDFPRNQGFTKGTFPKQLLHRVIAVFGFNKLSRLELSHLLHITLHLGQMVLLKEFENGEDGWAGHISSPPSVHLLS